MFLKHPGAATKLAYTSKSVPDTHMRPQVSSVQVDPHHHSPHHSRLQPKWEEHLHPSQAVLDPQPLQPAPAHPAAPPTPQPSETRHHAQHMGRLPMLLGTDITVQVHTSVWHTRVNTTWPSVFQPHTSQPLWGNVSMWGSHGLVAGQTDRQTDRQKVRQAVRLQQT